MLFFGILVGIFPCVGLMVAVFFGIYVSEALTPLAGAADEGLLYILSY